MNYEVEQKFAAADLGRIEAALQAMGAAIAEPQTQCDLYLAHPARDFAESDEALRIRRVGEKNCITYKGPKIDETTKTRREIELPISPGADGATAWRGLFKALGFAPVAEVRKTRRKATVAWQGREVEIALDQVEEVGTFVELELSDDDEGLNAARQSIAALASELGLSGGERRSYLELLLDRRARGDA